MIGKCDSRIVVQHQIDEEISAQLKLQTELARADRNKPKAKSLTGISTPLPLPSKQTQKLSLPRALSLVTVSKSSPIIPLSSSKNREDHPWIVLQGLPASTTLRDIERFLDGISLDKPLSHSSESGVMTVLYESPSANSGLETPLIMDVYVRCHSCEGAQVASLRNEEPMLLSGSSSTTSVSIPVTLRVGSRSLPLSEIRWACGIGFHLHHNIQGNTIGTKRPISPLSLLLCYEREWGIPREFLVGMEPLIRRNHWALIARLKTTENEKKKDRREKKKRKRSEKVDDALDHLPPLPSVERIYGDVRHVNGTEMEDPLDFFVGLGANLMDGGGVHCDRCRSVVRDIECILTCLSSFWSHSFISTPNPSSSCPLNLLQRSYSLYSCLYLQLLNEFHQGGHLKGCNG